MLLGLGTLSQLRALCLPGTFDPAGEKDTQFDATLAAIGRGVSAQFDSLCNRRFARQVDAVELFSCDQGFFSLAGYPVEKVSVIETSEPAISIAPGAWQASDLPQTLVLQPNAGLISQPFGWGAWYGGCRTVRVTYTGGYFVADDPPAEGEPDAEPMPEGATALPADVALAWQLQCAHVFEAANYFGTAAVRTPNMVSGKMPPLTQVEILPAAKATLDRYTRFSC